MHCMTPVIEYKAAEIQSCKIQDQLKGFLVSQITAINADRVPGVMTAPISYVIVCTLIYIVSRIHTEMYRDVPRCTEMYRDVPRCTEMYRGVDI